MADEPLTATVTGTLEGETVNYLLVRAAGEEAGEYEITVTPGENPNYTVTAVNGVYTITAAEEPETVIPSYSLVIHYWAEDGPAAADFRATYPEGTSFNVASPAKGGYTVDQPHVTGVIQADTEIDVYYTKQTYTLTVRFLNMCRAWHNSCG